MRTVAALYRRRTCGTPDTWIDHPGAIADPDPICHWKTREPLPGRRTTEGPLLAREMRARAGPRPVLSRPARPAGPTAETRRCLTAAGFLIRLAWGMGDAVVSRKAGLLEREDELASLRAVVEGVSGGRARVAVIEGPAGIGKSRLLGELRVMAAAAGLRVLSARGGELEREYPFGVVRQLFEPLLVGASARDLRLVGAAGAARPVFETFEAAGARPLGDVSFATLHGLYWLAADLAADGPTLLAVDDLHWCDRPSLRFLAYLVRRLEGLPIIVAGALRAGEPEADANLVGEIAADPSTVVIRPHALSWAAVHELVVERLGPAAEEPFSAACHHATAGNPLLLEQLLLALEADRVRPDAARAGAVREIGPRAVSRSVLLRLARLPGDAAVVAQAVAVLGDGAGLPTIARLAGLAETDAAEAIGVLAQTDIVRPRIPFAFVHPLVRQAVYGELSEVERDLRHARAAETLLAGGAAAEQVAAHLLVTSQRGAAWVAEALQRAGREAARKGAAESAVAYLRRALEEPPAAESRAQILLELGLAETLIDARAAAEHLGQAYDALADPRQRGLLAGALGPTLLFSGAVREGVRIAREAGAALPEGDDVRRRLEAFELCAILFGAGDAEAFGRLAAQRPPARGDGPGAKMLAAVAAMVWTYWGRPSDACAELALAALADGELLAADNGDFMMVAATIALTLADRDEVLPVWDAALAAAHRRGSLFSLSAVYLWQGFALYRRGELGDAEQSLRSFLALVNSYGYGPEASGYTGPFLAATLLERGDIEGAREVIERSPVLAGTDSARWWLMSRARLLLAEGRPEQALADAEALERASGWVSNPAAAPWRTLKAQALERLGHAGGLALALEELSLARRFGAPGTVGRALRVLGTLEREQGLEHLCEAVAVLRGSPARLEHAKALAALGAALRRAGQRREAREPLREALDLAHRCGAWALAARAREELVAAGAKPRRTALRGVDALTASELRVARRAAEGLGNREIAQSLFVTIRTVQGHLANAYEKLDLTTREQLAGALAEPASLGHPHG